jgi:hypothetical protein
MSAGNAAAPEDAAATHRHAPQRQATLPSWQPWQAAVSWQRQALPPCPPWQAHWLPQLQRFAAVSLMVRAAVQPQLPSFLSTMMKPS